MSLAAAKEWERRRAALLHGAFMQAEILVKEGKTVGAALAECALVLSGTIIHMDGKPRFLKCSAKTLDRAFRKWRAMGRSADGLLHGYSAGFGPRISPELIAEFQRLCTLEGILNFSAAMDALHRMWKSDQYIPGLGHRTDFNRARGLPVEAVPDFPVSRRTLYNYAPSRVERALGTKGRAAMKAVSSYVDLDYSKLRKGELYVMDDVRLDIICVDELTGRVVEVVMYILMEVASRAIVAYVMKPAHAIKQEDVDELLAYGLQTPGYGIGKGYTTHLKFERGTIACSEASQNILEGVSNGRLKVHRTSMVGGVRWTGAPRDKASGHAAGKAVIESFNRKLHLMLMDLPGQRGNSFRNQPANLGYEGAGQFTPGSLADEAQKLASFQFIAGKRVSLKLPMLYFRDLEKAVRLAIKRHNTDPGHSYNGHGKFIQAEVSPGLWESVYDHSPV
jgi:hypothetical protein